MEGKMNLAFTQRSVALLNNRNLYIGAPEYYSTIDTDDIIKYAAKAAGVTQACMVSTFAALYDAFEYYLCNGHSFKLDDLGTFSLAMSTVTSDPTAADVVSGADAVTGLGVNFLPAVAIKEMLNGIAWNSVVKAGALAEFTEFDPRTLKIGSDSVNLLTPDSTEFHSMTIGSALVLNGWNCPASCVVKVEGTDASGAEVSEEFTMAIATKKTCIAMKATAKATKAIAKITKITVGDTEYPYSGETSALTVKFGNNLIFDGASFGTDNQKITISGSTSDLSGVTVDGTVYPFSSNTGKLATTSASITLDAGSHTIVVGDKTYNITVTSTATASVATLSANGVTVANGGTSGMAAGQSYTMVATGQHLDLIDVVDIKVPNGSSVSSKAVSTDGTRLQFVVTYGGTEGTIKIGNYFTVNITTTSQSKGAVTSVYGIAKGGSINCNVGDDMAVVGTNLSSVTFKATNSSTGADKSSDFTWNPSSASLVVGSTADGMYNIYFYNADGDTVYTASVVVGGIV